ncbi:S-layer homology domain-containing protein [Sporosarcina koreensis]|uniref:S-layer homology domain-containing protein n=1 Tax=Sporosarcina koreensis TaxID=334735 RepID=UPI000693BF0A|nr:S-layer homology domain-containing protein [Sporosarcina koreensis]
MAQQPKSYKKFVATAATATLVASAIVPVASANVSTSAFTDVPASYKDAVNFVVENNIAKGMTEKQFGISMQIKRGDVAIMIANAAGLNNEKAPSAGFTDVPKRGALAINSLKEAGVISGKTTTKFGFEDNVTRGEAALMLQKAFDLKAGDTNNEFTDVSERYKNAVNALVAHKVTNGINDTQFGTGNPIKRGDFAKFLYALKDRINIENPEEPPVVVEGTTLKLEAKSSTITANGADNTVITAQIIDTKTGEVNKDADDLVLAFTTTYGQLAHSRVTVQDGVATVVLTSEFSKKDIEAIVTARLIEAADESKWNDEIGNLVGETKVKFKPVSDEVGQKAPTITATESNSADRLTVFFDQNVNPATFLKMDGDTFVTDANGNVVFKPNAQLAIAQANEPGFKIRGLKAVANNPKAIEVILTEDHVLTDNKEVKVYSSFFANGNQQNSERSFILTDARTPELTSVDYIDGRTIDLIFSEPVDTYKDLSIDGGTVKLAKAGEFGEYHQNGKDRRHVVRVTTDKYMKDGKHSVQVTKVGDYASRTDNNNFSSNQTLDFVVPVNNVIPAAAVSVESPEQLRVTFNTPVSGFDASDLEFQVQDEDGNWVTKNNFDGFIDKNFDWKVTTVVPGMEYKLELDKDWTRIYDTKNTNENYYNHKYRVVLKEQTVMNDANGKKNEKQELSLNVSNSALNSPDTTSPVFASAPMKITSGVDKDKWVVEFNKPIKVAGLDSVGDTPSQLQGTTIPQTIVEFIGTDKDGKKVTVPGKIESYYNEDLKDTKILVKPDKELQGLVDQNSYEENWQIVVRNASDDVGNAAATLTKDFTVVKSPASFMVKSLDNGATYDGLSFYLSDDQKDEIVLTFTSPVRYTGNVDNALNLANYTVNGLKLPEGSIAKLEDSKPADGKDAYDQVRIVLPNNTLKTTENTINISKSLLSAGGIQISGMTEISELPADLNPGSVDKTALNAAITAANALNESEYTAGTWANFQTALTAAKNTAANATATAAQVTKATSDLNAAKAALVKKGETAVTLGSLNADVTIKTNPAGMKVVGFNKTKLPAEMQANAYTLTVGTKVYNFTVNEFNAERYLTEIDGTVSDADINAGVLKAVK